MFDIDQGGQGLAFAVSGVPGLKKMGGRKKERSSFATSLQLVALEGQR